MENSTFFLKMHGSKLYIIFYMNTYRKNSFFMCFQPFLRQQYLFPLQKHTWSLPTYIKLYCITNQSFLCTYPKVYLFYCFLFLGLRWNQSNWKDLRTNCHNWFTTLLKSHDLHAFPWVSRRTWTRWRVSFHRVRKYNRLLHHLGLSHGYGTNLWSSFRCTSNETPRVNSTKNGPFAPINFFPNLFHLA